MASFHLWHHVVVVEGRIGFPSPSGARLNQTGQIQTHIWVIHSGTFESRNVKMRLEMSFYTQQSTAAAGNLTNCLNSAHIYMPDYPETCVPHE